MIYSMLFEIHVLIICEVLCVIFTFSLFCIVLVETLQKTDILYSLLNW